MPGKAEKLCNEAARGKSLKDIWKCLVARIKAFLSFCQVLKRKLTKASEAEASNRLKALAEASESAQRSERKSSASKEVLVALLLPRSVDLAVATWRNLRKNRNASLDLDSLIYIYILKKWRRKQIDPSFPSFTISGLIVKGCFMPFFLRRGFYLLKRSEASQLLRPFGPLWGPELPMSQSTLNILQNESSISWRTLTRNCCFAKRPIVFLLWRLRFLGQKIGQMLLKWDTQWSI